MRRYEHLTNYTPGQVASCVGIGIPLRLRIAGPNVVLSDWVDKTLRMIREQNRTMAALTRKKVEFLASGSCANGYFGERTNCSWAYDPESQKTLLAHPGGFFSSGLPLAVDAREALWLLEGHHGKTNHYRINA
ncbi:MAG: hypothetical protein JEY79_19385 [Pseudodesulfovibrio sp.]|nr:hypothetical protein [Pseudodesulfovibrio sp.]